MELSGYYFRDILKKMRRRFVLTAGEQALYTELIDICNEEGWHTTLQISNGELTTALNCDEKTLARWRQSLVNCGLIKYVSGKSKRAFGTYFLQTTGNITTNTPTNVPVIPPTNVPVIPPTNVPDYNKLNKTKLKEERTDLKNPTSHKKNSFRSLSAEDAKKRLYEEMIPYADRYSKEMLRSFYDWWTMAEDGGSRVRLQDPKNKYFEVGKRLATWKRNEQGNYQNGNEKLIKDDAAKKAEQERIQRRQRELLEGD